MIFQRSQKHKHPPCTHKICQAWRIWGWMAQGDLLRQLYSTAKPSIPDHTPGHYPNNIPGQFPENFPDRCLDRFPNPFPSRPTGKSCNVLSTIVLSTKWLPTFPACRHPAVHQREPFPYRPSAWGRRDGASHTACPRIFRMICESYTCATFKMIFFFPKELFHSSDCGLSCATELIVIEFT